MSNQESILLTGATGNLGAVILDQLLAITTHSINIVLRRENAIHTLRTKYKTSTSRLSFTVIPDLSVPHAFDEAAATATAIIHCATPLGDPSNWLTSIIEPTWAIDKNILEAAKNSKSLKRVIICGTLLQAVGRKDLLDPTITITETSFIDTTLEEAKAGPWVSAYAFAKTAAEKKMWAWLDENTGSAGFDVVMLLPPAITGRSPQVGYKPMMDSPGGIGRVTNALFVGRKGEEADAFFPWFMDTDDVARTHILSLSPTKVPGNKRYLLTHPDPVNLRSITKELRDKETGLKDRLPEFAETPSVWAKEKMVKIDTSKTDEVFGTQWKNAYDSIKATVMDVVQWENKNGVEIGAWWDGEGGVCS
ncbi:NAD(P)-binding protein [Massarina eburnea CBS 473.64]|uniref:NAD(P)-binding protein n=1 Tax=Massarina eburnea CBS 473.64 TaxID=1395130 RepID=A0A6A6SHK1_9PLEO|nr:NAD(P)-binding protein [Massarina eburnea CBS 473.64]